MVWKSRAESTQDGDTDLLCHQSSQYEGAQWWSERCGRKKEDGRSNPVASKLVSLFIFFFEEPYSNSKSNGKVDTLTLQ